MTADRLAGKPLPLHTVLHAAQEVRALLAALRLSDPTHGHARGRSVFRNAREVVPELPSEPAAARAFLIANAPLERLDDAAARALSASHRSARRRPRAPPHRLLSLKAISTRSGTEEMVRHIYASLSRMIHK
jgi:hypothetical protein